MERLENGMGLTNYEPHDANSFTQNSGTKFTVSLLFSIFSTAILSLLLLSF